MSLLQYKLSKNDNNFENNKFKDLYGLGIPDILMNIMSCHGFYKYSIYTVILACWSALARYYISKGFVIVETEVGGVDNITITMKEQIHAAHLHQEESLLTCKLAIP